MNKKEKDVLIKLQNLYKELYPSREIFASKLFPFEPDDVSQIIDNILKDTGVTNSKSVIIREEISAIKTKEQVREYMEKLNLLGAGYRDISENEIASKITQAEYKYLYSILYNTPIASKTKKDIIIQHIIKYFNGIDRAQSLKP